jgi:hypothetical protein
MRRHLSIALIAVFGLLGVTLSTAPAKAQQADCDYYQVSAVGLNVFSQPRGDASFIGALKKNDFVCVIGEQNVPGDRIWAHIAGKVSGQGQRTAMDGWAIMNALQRATQNQVTALSNAPPPAPQAAAAPPPPPAVQAAPPPPARAAKTAPPAAPAASSDTSAQDILRFTQKITEGPVPVNGSSLAELITGIPIYPPIPGLPDNVWKKTCNNCHQWNQQSLCVQAKIYLNDPKMTLRIQHPYGGPEKVAMMKWAKGGCQ